MIVKMKNVAMSFLGAVLCATLLLASPAAAQTNQKEVKCGDDQVAVGVSVDGVNCVDKGTTIENNVIVVWMSNIIKFLTVGIGLAATGGIVYGGFLYLTAQGNAGKAQKGVATIMNALIAILLYALMFAIINFIIPGGVLR